MPVLVACGVRNSGGYNSFAADNQGVNSMRLISPDAIVPSSLSPNREALAEDAHPPSRGNHHYGNGTSSALSRTRNAAMIGGAMRAQMTTRGT